VPLARPFKDRADIAFIGGFRHYPNVDAVKYFATQVMPLLRAKLPGVRFLVYGSNVPQDIEALAGEDVIIKGYVRDVSEVFDHARIFVAPLLTGAGMKGKVLDCIAAGIPSVLSPVAAEGVGLRDGSDAIIARKPEDWVSAIVKLYGDEAAWTAMSKSAHALAATQYSFEHGIQQLSEALAMIDFFLLPGNPALHANTARPVSPVAVAAEADTANYVAAAPKKKP
jgi:glycosyltransferase involved in cell wall biosynthesis